MERPALTSEKMEPVTRLELAIFHYALSLRHMT